MSESSMIEIVTSSMRTIWTALERERIMGGKIIIHMKEINVDLSTLRSSEIRSNIKINQSISPLLESAKPISFNINQSNAASILDTSKKLAATMYALSDSSELKELHSEVKLKIPQLDSLVNETNYFLKTGNIDALQVKSAEIKTNFKKMLHILKSKQLSMEKEEIKITSRLISNSLKEIGFGSIKEISSKSGSIFVRAVDQKSFTSVFAAVNARDGIRIDTKGFVGNECTRVVDALVDKLKDKGIEARKKNRVFHNKAEGGELVKAVEPLFNPLESVPNSIHQKELDRQRKIHLSTKRQRA